MQRTSGWRFEGWDASEEDHTGGASGSIHAKAQLSPAEGLPQRISKTAAIEVALPTGSVRLRYYRKLALTTFMGESAFRVSIDDETVDEATAAGAGAAGWIARTVDLSGFAGRRVALQFVLTVAGSLNYMSSGEAWLDDVTIA